MVLGGSAKKVYKAVLIGCGSMGSYCMDELVGIRSRIILPYGHAEVVKMHPRTELVAGADPDPGRLEDFGRRWGVTSLYTDHRDMLEREQPDIVCIASPPDLHAQHVIDSAERGVKGIFCEKPLAPTLREADALIQACDEHGVRLSINHTRRGDPFVQQARRLIDEGELGQILTLQITWAGRLFLTGTHCFDLLNYFAGDVPTRWLMGHAEGPTAQMTAIPTQRGEDVGGTAYVVYENGIRAFFNGRDGSPILQAHIYGTEGMIIIDDNEAQLWKLDSRGRFRDLHKHRFPQMMYYHSPMTFLLTDLIEAIETGREPMSSGRTARHALAQILATHYSSQRDNQKVNFPFEELDMRPPYRWFSPDGRPLYRVESTQDKSA